MVSLCSSLFTPILRAFSLDLNAQLQMLGNTLNITALSSKTIKLYDCFAEREQQETPLLTKSTFPPNYSYLNTSLDEAQINKILLCRCYQVR